MSSAGARTERLFSYGTLQQEAVQLANFGRKLTGVPDAVKGYRLSSVAIADPDVVSTSSLAVHPILVPSDDPAEEIEGVVFTVTSAELFAADRYETDAYTRVSVCLRSGTEAWVYVSPGAG